MFPRVKLELKTSPKKFVAANGEQIGDLSEKNVHSRTNEGIQKCITFRSASVVKPLIQCKRLSEPETLSFWMKRIRTFETFETNSGQAAREQRYVHNGHVDWLGETGPVSACREDRQVVTAALCRGRDSRKQKMGKK